MRLGDTKSDYDIVVIGGGVSGAGVFHRAVSMGLSALMVEARDFAWGTSSRSSKMVHGGLRYLKQGKIGLTRASVRERQRLLSVYPGLVTPLSFVMPLYKDLGPSKTVMSAGLNIYSFMAGRRQHTFFDPGLLEETIPGVRKDRLVSAVEFLDAQVDDARLVLRLIFDGCDAGGHAVNYVKAFSLERDGRGRVCAVNLKSSDTGIEKTVRTRAVINATGAFAETLHPSPVKDLHIRPLRGSHLIFSNEKYRLDKVLTFSHPTDGRPVFIFPWETCVVLGTTDVDHGPDLCLEPAISQEESDYLMQGLDAILPGAGLTQDDVMATIAGVRPVLSKAKTNASKESRDHAVWTDNGLVTVTGGKLTTFDLIARDALKAAASFLPARALDKDNGFVAEDAGETGMPLPDFPGLDPQKALRLSGRYGNRACQLVKRLDTHTRKDLFDPVDRTRTLWAEILHAAACEQVMHLDDLLLRRVRIGLLLPNGGMDVMPQIKALTSPVLGWDDAQWQQEITAYKNVWQHHYSPNPWQV